MAFLLRVFQTKLVATEKAIFPSGPWTLGESIWSLAVQGAALASGAPPVDIFDVLAHGPIVWFDEEEAVLISWNGNGVFTIWQVQDNDFVALESWPAARGMDFERACETAKARMMEVYRLLKAMD